MPKIQIHEMSAVLMGQKIDEAILNDGVLYKVRGMIHSAVEEPVSISVGRVRIDTCISVRRRFPR